MGNCTEKINWTFYTVKQVNFIDDEESTIVLFTTEPKNVLHMFTSCKNFSKKLFSESMIGKKIKTTGNDVCIDELKNFKTVTYKINQIDFHQMQNSDDMCIRFALSDNRIIFKRTAKKYSEKLIRENFLNKEIVILESESFLIKNFYIDDKKLLDELEKVLDYQEPEPEADSGEMETPYAPIQRENAMNGMTSLVVTPRNVPLGNSGFTPSGNSGFVPPGNSGFVPPGNSGFVPPGNISFVISPREIGINSATLSSNESVFQSHKKKYFFHPNCYQDSPESKLM